MDETMDLATESVPSESNETVKAILWVSTPDAPSFEPEEEQGSFEEIEERLGIHDINLVVMTEDGSIHRLKLECSWEKMTAEEDFDEFLPDGEEHEDSNTRCENCSRVWRKDNLKELTGETLKAWYDDGVFEAGDSVPEGVCPVCAGPCLDY